MDIARLGKAGVLARIPDPANKRQFLYDLRQSVRGYVAPSIQIAEHELQERREPYEAELPAGVKLILGGIDTQDTSLEYLVMGVGDRHEFWCLDRGSIPGDLAKGTANL